VSDPSWVIRPAQSADTGAIVDLARRLGAGMTTLPPDPETIERKIACSIATFAGESIEDSQYILVLEQEGRAVGLSGVYPRIGDAHGFFSYKRTRLIQRSVDLGRRYEIELLTLSNDYTGATEIGTLAVLPELRGTGAARLLARARYMLIGAFPDRFASRVMAEMRGWQDEQGQSPFWNAIGARFFDMAFDEADQLSAVQGAGFIADLMPKQPIYTALLPATAREAIGRPHPVSARAMAMLMEEDFRHEAHVDVFDGGPQVHIERDQIRTIRETRTFAAHSGGDGGAAPMLLSNGDLADFRVALAPCHESGERLGMAASVMATLGVEPGMPVRAAPGRWPGLRR
jgi:arginine N-succinyltransferase